MFILQKKLKGLVTSVINVNFKVFLLTNIINIYGFKTFNLLSLTKVFAHILIHILMWIKNF